MVADEITRIKEAEREAMTLVADARSRADERIRQAGIERNAILSRWEGDAQRERERIIEAARAAADSEAEQIRRDGKERAEALVQEAQAQIPRAVEFILRSVAGERDAVAR
ncbi:MAG: hypothetical protein KO206_07765 [Methanomicrobiaceae archaeon]|nr:hypothetical protein [Methanomicrobiaceae archaeon]MDD5419118.1 hypothetical protein [Methanomicrobiaceae archaeon]